MNREQGTGCGGAGPTETASARKPLELLSVVIPARDEEGCVATTVERLYAELQHAGIPHEILVVNDGSVDATADMLADLRERVPTLVPVENTGKHGFGRAVVCGLDRIAGDAVVILMADESDDCRDVVLYWRELCKGYDCVFGSRFLPGATVEGYPLTKLTLNRAANLFLRLLFRIDLNDTTNAFKGYRREVIDGCRPLISPHFNLTIELPLKAIVRGFSWSVVPVRWRNRRSGAAKFRIKEMGSRYLHVCLQIWLEHLLRRSDRRKLTRGALRS